MDKTEAFHTPATFPDPDLGLNTGGVFEKRTFMYNALNTNTNSFRLIKVLPDHDSSPLRIAISSSSLDGECPVYTALSYTWQYNPPRDDVQAYCNGSYMSIGYNLWSFLHQFRKTDDLERQLWVDAICIDQQNIKERNHQVAQMRNIYSKAECVIVWLGDDISTDDAFEAFNLVIGPGRLSYQNTEDDLRLHRPPGHWKAVERFLNRPYWNRSWIIQEVIMARTVEIRCGDRTSPLDCFENMCQWLERAEWHFPRRHEASSRITVSKSCQLFKHRREWWKTPGIARTFSLSSLFKQYISSTSSDPRDKVYALLGIACKIYNRGCPIHVDYTKTSIEVLMDAVRNQCAWATRKQELDSLSLIALLREAFSLEHGKIHQHVRLRHHRLRPITDVVYATENFLIFGNIVQVDSGSFDLRIFPEWMFRNRHPNTNRQKLSQLARHGVAVDVTSMESDTTCSPDDTVDRGPVIRDSEASTRFTARAGLAFHHVQAGDLVCVELEQFRSHSKHGVLLRSVEDHDEAERWRCVGEILISDVIFPRLA